MYLLQNVVCLKELFCLTGGCLEFFSQPFFLLPMESLLISGEALVMSVFSMPISLQTMHFAFYIFSAYFMWPKLNSFLPPYFLHPYPSASSLIFSSSSSHPLFFGLNLILWPIRQDEKILRKI